ncbi:MAG: hypothetical protein FD130_577 [Halothiobacillaceae bacterium]|nr:MAG: hypothetical protein FD130_577 [Halothiobacillaceae bacterium]
MNGRLCKIAVVLLVLARAGAVGAYELSGMVAFDSRLFLEEPAFPGQSSDACGWSTPTRSANTGISGS